jgi:hypothetical protein
MRKLILSALAASAAITGSVPADARQGCGIGYHRGSYGRCIANRPYGVAPRPPVVGVYYAGRGYWFGGRYWTHRYRWHGGWRYR